MIDRSQWSSGPWDNEPDRHEFVYKGYECRCVRNFIGAWLGYVLLSDSVDRATSWYESSDLDVHGGITYEDTGVDPKTGVEHTVIGFDCAHYNDRVPYSLLEDVFVKAEKARNKKYPDMEFNPEWTRREYRTLDFVVKELQGLVDQIIERRKSLKKDTCGE